MALIGMTVFAGFAVTVAQYQNANRKIQQHLDLQNTISQLQTAMINTINDNNSWQNTINDNINNASMACIANENCGSISPTAFVLWTAQSSNYNEILNALYDARTPSSGFDLKGNRCNTFDATNGNSACPIRFDMTWATSGCSPAPCRPVVVIKMNVSFKPGSDLKHLILNEEKLELSFQQSSIAADIPCSQSPDPAEVAMCSSPPHPDYKLICTRNGYKCGQFYGNTN